MKTLKLQSRKHLSPKGGKHANISDFPQDILSFINQADYIKGRDLEFELVKAYYKHNKEVKGCKIAASTFNHNFAQIISLESGEFVFSVLDSRDSKSSPVYLPNLEEFIGYLVNSGLKKTLERRLEYFNEDIEKLKSIDYNLTGTLEFILPEDIDSNGVIMLGDYIQHISYGCFNSSDVEEVTKVVGKGVVSIGSKNFNFMERLEFLDFPNLETVENDSFIYLPKFNYLRFDKLKSIGSGSFNLLGDLKLLSMKSLEFIKSNNFNQGSLKGEFLVPNLKVIGESNFHNLEYIEEGELVIELLELVALGLYNFEGLKNVEINKSNSQIIETLSFS